MGKDVEKNGHSTARAELALKQNRNRIKPNKTGKGYSITLIEYLNTHRLTVVKTANTDVGFDNPLHTKTIISKSSLSLIL